MIMKGLPRSLYDDGWYAEKPDEYRKITLCLSKNQFERIGDFSLYV